MNPLKLKLRAVVIFFARLVGSTVRDERTGRVLGRALFVPFRGKIHVIGLDKIVIPEFAPQDRLTYWKQEIVFKSHPPPDFPHESDA